LGALINPLSYNLNRTRRLSVKYRADIDGLRALAVVPVILFHAGLTIFENGFLGVDVFFVISGFLISFILMKEIDTKGLDIISFYERRARRILPALFFMILVILPFAWFNLYPGDMKDFSQSLVAVALFSSNILFWREVGYFDTNAELKPLLHTWSLSIEEQFYFIFPLLLLMIWRFRSHYISLILVALTSASLALAFWSREFAASSGFYLIGARAWELLVGVLGAYFLWNKQSSTGALYTNKTANALTLSGLGLMLIGYAGLFDLDNIILGQLYVTLGTVLLLIVNQDTIVSRLLSQKIFVGIGLISYSAYLWHQPLFAFVRIKEYEHIPYLMTSLIVLTFMLAYFSWKYIEGPFRNRTKITSKAIAFYSVVGLVVLAGIGALGHLKNGNLWAYDKDDLEVVGYKTQREMYVWSSKRAVYDMPFDQSAAVKILIIGDSNSGDFMNALVQNKFDSKVSFSAYTIQSHCGSLFIDPDIMVQYIGYQDEHECRAEWKLSETRQKLLEDADYVFIAAAWRQWQEQYIKESMDGLVQEYGDKFWVFGTKHLNFKPSEILQIKPVDRPLYKLVAKTEDIERNAKFQAVLGDHFIDPYAVMCEQELCPVFNDKSEIYTFDGFHLTKSGADYLSAQLQPFVDRIINTRSNLE